MPNSKMFSDSVYICKRLHYSLLVFEIIADCWLVLGDPSVHSWNVLFLTGMVVWSGWKSFAAKVHKNLPVPCSPECQTVTSLWCHDMETLSTLLALCEGNPPHKELVMQCFDVFFDSNLNKLLNKQSSRWWDSMMLTWDNCNIAMPKFIQTITHVLFMLKQDWLSSQL